MTSFRTLHSGPHFNYAIAPAWDGTSLWLVNFDQGSEGTRPAGLWRSDDGGRSFALVCSSTDVFPADASPFVAALVATGPGELELFCSGYHGRFDGKRFVTQPVPPFDFGLEGPSSIAADPDRKTLVFVDVETGIVFEHGKGAWKKIGTFERSNSPFNAAAGWDAARKQIVIVHGGEQGWILSRALTWDGKKLAPLPGPESRWPDQGSMFGAPHPRTGRVVFRAPGICTMLGKNGFEPLALDAGPMDRHARMTGGPGALVTWDSDEIVSWDGAKITRTPTPISSWAGEVDRSNMFRVQGENLFRSDRTGAMEAVYSAKKKTEPSRLDATASWDADGERVVISAGREGPWDTCNAVRDTWEWTAKRGYRELPTKGKPIARGGGLGAIARGLLVVTGGTKPTLYAWKATPLHTTEEFDGTRWTAFPDAFKGAKAPEKLALVAADPTTGTILAVSARDAVVQVWSYGGSGVWNLGLTLDADGAQGVQHLQFAFDRAQRRLVAKGTVRAIDGSAGIFAASLAEWLDALPPRSSTATSKPAKVARASSPPERYLVFRESGPGKYWFATLAGKQWTARWGRRGSDGQTKTYAFPSPDKARADFEKSVSKKLDEGYVDSTTGEAIARLAQRAAFTIKVTKKAGIDRIGGAAPVTPPICKGCRKPMGVVAVFGADAERLALPTGKALAIFMCETAGKDCKTWDPDAGANAVVVLPKAAPASGAGVTYTQVMELDRAAEGVEDQPSPGGSKLGGFPTWVQDPEPPSCAKCKGPMTFALQLDGDDAGANFGDSGIGYAFTCKHAAKFLWQCS